MGVFFKGQNAVGSDGVIATALCQFTEIEDTMCVLLQFKQLGSRDIYKWELLKSGLKLQ